MGKGDHNPIKGVPTGSRQGSHLTGAGEGNGPLDKNCLLMPPLPTLYLLSPAKKPKCQHMGISNRVEPSSLETSKGQGEDEYL